MDGGPSQVDTFDPKSMLDKYDGKDPGQLFKVEPTQFNNNGKVLANRLSYFFWSAMPDAELFKLAESGKLNDPAVLRQKVDRLLNDRRRLQTERSRDKDCHKRSDDAQIARHASFTIRTGATYDVFLSAQRSCSQEHRRSGSEAFRLVNRKASEII